MEEKSNETFYLKITKTTEDDWLYAWNIAKLEVWKTAWTVNYKPVSVYKFTHKLWALKS